MPSPGRSGADHTPPPHDAFSCRRDWPGRRPLPLSRQRVWICILSKRMIGPSASRLRTCIVRLGVVKPVDFRAEGRSGLIYSDLSDREKECLTE